MPQAAATSAGRLPVVPATANGASRCSEENQDEADDQHDDADRPEDRDLRDEADNEQDKSENDHRSLLFSGWVGLLTTAQKRRVQTHTAVIRKSGLSERVSRERWRWRARPGQPLRLRRCR